MFLLIFSFVVRNVRYFGLSQPELRLEIIFVSIRTLSASLSAGSDRSIDIAASKSAIFYLTLFHQKDYTHENFLLDGFNKSAFWQIVNSNIGKC
eukprot:m.174491 g.174491  ORF g.174491 m.174491 type:complete len:94 (-) comp15407_c0_seq16:218-499(-)